MTSSETLQQVVETLSPYVKLEEGAVIAAESDILNDLKVNSARIIDIVLAVEDRFGIKIEEDEEDTINTVADLVSLVDSKRAA